MPLCPLSHLQLSAMPPHFRAFLLHTKLVILNGSKPHMFACLATSSIEQHKLSVRCHAALYCPDTTWTLQQMQDVWVARVHAG